MTNFSESLTYSSPIKNEGILQRFAWQIVVSELTAKETADPEYIRNTFHQKAGLNNDTIKSLINLHSSLVYERTFWVEL